MKRNIFIILIIGLLVTCTISLYSSFAYNEEASKLDESTADYNIIYSLKEQSDKEISVSSKEEKNIEITLTNPYDSKIKYGMYYSILNLSKMPEGVSISLADESPAGLEGLINTNESKTITIKISNQSEYNVDLLVGALVGFENGNIEELIKNNQELIK